MSGDTSLSSDTSFKFPAAPNGAADAPASDALKSGRAGSSASSFSPNFTVSRDGFQPDAKFDRGLPGESRDPFDFDLGPSPFAAKSARAAELEAPAPAETAAAQSKPFAAMTEPKASEPEVEKTDSEAGEPEADEVKSAPLADARLPEKPVSFVAPSISATMAPTPAQQPELASDGLSTSLKAEPSPKAESSPKAEPAPSSAPFGDLPGRTFKRDVMEFASALKSSSPIVESASTGFEAKADDFGADQEPAPMQSGLPVTQADAHQREMEDTVAELLRPMLRTWLAENMPRIVERALLRELESQPSSGDRKTAAE